MRGNPDHPFTKGRLCVKVNNYQDRVNSPDRILYPLRRAGPKGAGHFERISWDEAIEEIARRWKDIVATSGPKAMARYFRKVRDMKAVKPDQEQARDWLPEAMNFPAIDPDKQIEQPEDTEMAEAA